MTPATRAAARTIRVDTGKARNLARRRLAYPFYGQAIAHPDRRAQARSLTAPATEPDSAAVSKPTWHTPVIHCAQSLLTKS
jgi:hypothetical protein